MFVAVIRMISSVCCSSFSVPACFSSCLVLRALSFGRSESSEGQDRAEAEGWANERGDRGEEQTTSSHRAAARTRFGVCGKDGPSCADDLCFGRAAGKPF